VVRSLAQLLRVCTLTLFAGLAVRGMVRALMQAVVRSLMQAVGRSLVQLLRYVMWRMRSRTVVRSLAQLLWDLSGAVAMGSLAIVGGGKFQNFHFVFVSPLPGKITRANFETLAGAVSENAYAEDGAISLEVWAVGGVTEIPAEPG
jgi:hypothetical protein